MTTSQTTDPGLSRPADIHVGFLDSVRGLAALSVFFEHYVIAFDLPIRDPFWVAAWDHTPLHILWDGAGAVSLFFVLSGLVLSLKHFRSTPQPDLSAFNLAAYISGRCFRLIPPYLAALILSSVAYGLTTGATPFLEFQRESPWLDQLWGHSVDVFGMIAEANLFAMPDEIVMVPQSWTLAVELLYSFLIPLGILLAARSSAWLILFTVLTIKLLGAASVLLHFALGILLAKHYRAIELWLRHRKWKRRALLILGILAYTARDYLYTFPSGSWTSILSAIGAALILAGVIGSGRLRSLLSLSPLRFLGRVSFSFYLLHMLVLFCLMPFLWNALGAAPRQSEWIWWLGLLAAGMASLGVSTVFHRYIELSSITAGKVIMTWFSRPVRTEASRAA